MYAPVCQYWIICLSFIGAAEHAKQSRAVESAQQVRVGMTRQQVLDILGPPDIDYRPQWDHWCYGRTVDLASMLGHDGRLNPLPFRWRLFFYSDDDVVVRWGDNDKVVAMNSPDRFPSPAEFDQILDIYEFYRTVWEILATG